MSISAGEIQALLSQAQSIQNDAGYQIQILNNYQQLIDTVKKENKTIKATYIDGIAVNSADSQQSRYVIQSSSILSNISKYGFWIYLILGLILSGIIIRKPLSIYIRFALVALVMLYPFYIYPLEELLYAMSRYIWSVITSVAYNTGYGNTSMEYGIASSQLQHGSVQEVNRSDSGSYTDFNANSGSVQDNTAQNGSTSGTLPGDTSPGSGSTGTSPGSSGGSGTSPGSSGGGGTSTIPPLPTPVNTSTPVPTTFPPFRFSPSSSSVNTPSDPQREVWPTQPPNPPPIGNLDAQPPTTPPVTTLPPVTTPPVTTPPVTTPPVKT